MISCVIYLQAQSDALDAQVTATEGKLQELKERQKQLEARNAVLESAASASLSESAGVGVICCRSILAAMPALCKRTRSSQLSVVLHCAILAALCCHEIIFPDINSRMNINNSAKIA